MRMTNSSINYPTDDRPSIELKYHHHHWVNHNVQKSGPHRNGSNWMANCDPRIGATTDSKAKATDWVMFEI